MHARVTTTTLGSDQPDDSAAVFAEVAPTLRSIGGYKGMVVLSEVDGRRVIALSFWESSDALASGTDTMNRLRNAETSQRAVDDQETVEYQVVGFDLDA